MEVVSFPNADLGLLQSHKNYTLQTTRDRWPRCGRGMSSKAGRCSAFYAVVRCETRRGPATGVTLVTPKCTLVVGYGSGNSISRLCVPGTPPGCWSKTLRGLVGRSVLPSRAPMPSSPHGWGEKQSLCLKKVMKASKQSLLKKIRLQE